MIVKLTYFKPSGKYYSSAKYQTSCRSLLDIWREVRAMVTSGSMPGLSDHRGREFEFIILVRCKEAEGDHPKLIIPQHLLREQE